MWLPTASAIVETRSIDDPAPVPVNPNQQSSGTPAPSTSTLSSSSMVRTGEIMLIFSLLLIFLVACFVALHLYLRSRKKKAKPLKQDKKKKMKNCPSGPPELHSVKKEFVELVGTPVCEIGDSEPRYEMEDVEVQEVSSPLDEPIGRAISTYGPIAIPFAVHLPAPEPEIREFATYWSLRIVFSNTGQETELQSSIRSVVFQELGIDDRCVSTTLVLHKHLHRKFDGSLQLPSYREQAVGLVMLLPAFIIGIFLWFRAHDPDKISIQIDEES
ncbi:hypothetical protein K504DRAFT_537130 [Pleomassaria siparia CBS 279.74]|uniref:Uncharacterized protein n=1 Tax=Pleomassaria siparia CBS 279.74 TaxID=1314801 RepID=A0A6G1JY72_9PLEO|nr:hypothetical protein K504DRAFT_537130 [Pleomassaria siparia CBS 279.74]